MASDARLIAWARDRTAFELGRTIADQVAKKARGQLDREAIRRLRVLEQIQDEKQP